MNKFNATVSTPGFDFDGANGVTYRVPATAHNVDVLTNGDDESAKGYIGQYFGHNYKVDAIRQVNETEVDRAVFATKNRSAAVIDNSYFRAPTVAIGGDNLAKSRFQ